MSRLDKLRKSILEMQPDELREHVRRIRMERRIVRERPATKVAKRKEGTRAKDQLAKLLSNMSPEQRAKLLKDLGHDDAADQGSTDRQDHSEGQSED